jgi:hypothetical protein
MGEPGEVRRRALARDQLDDHRARIGVAPFIHRDVGEQSDARTLRVLLRRRVGGERREVLACLCDPVHPQMEARTQQVRPGAALRELERAGQVGLDAVVVAIVTGEIGAREQGTRERGLAAPARVRLGLEPSRLDDSIEALQRCIVVARARDGLDGDGVRVQLRCRHGGAGLATADQGDRNDQERGASRDHGATLGRCGGGR